MAVTMFEKHLENPYSLFHTLVENTKIDTIVLNEKQALHYLKLINNLIPYYSNMSNYDLIDYQKIIYIEETFFNNTQIMSLIKDIKTKISQFYVYKNKYFKRLTNDIPNDYFNYYYDEYLVKSLNLNPKNIKGELIDE